MQQIFTECMSIANHVVMQGCGDVAGRLRHLEAERAIVSALSHGPHDGLPFDVAQVGRQVFVVTSVIVVNVCCAQPLPQPKDKGGQINCVQVSVTSVQADAEQLVVPQRGH